MTGQLIFCKNNKITAGGHSDKNNINCEQNNHTRVIFTFKDKSKLIFNDLRTFGILRVINLEELKLELNKFGKEALDIDFKYLKSISQKKETCIKTLLLNQKLVAGIGNIYADEALFLAELLPWRMGKSLKNNELKKLTQSIKQILRKAIKYRGTTFNDYVDASGNKGNFVGMLNVYGRKGEKCRKCGTEIKKMKLTQRGTHYCKKCQR